MIFEDGGSPVWSDTHARQAALRRAVVVLMVSSVQMQSPSSLSQVSLWPKPVSIVRVVRFLFKFASRKEEV